MPAARSMLRCEDSDTLLLMPAPCWTNALMAALLAASVTAGGCVRRTVTIDSDPPGALVWLNDREVGRTPVDVDFLFYGEYDVRLVREDMEPLLSRGDVSPPWWDMIPLDFGAELWPGELHSRHRVQFELEPRRDGPEALLERARSLRTQLDDSDGDPGAVAESRLEP